MPRKAGLVNAHPMLNEKRNAGLGKTGGVWYRTPKAGRSEI